ncbi:MAG: hypothetical protein ABI353_09030 [Isosphaeraceae bacterium]
MNAIDLGGREQIEAPERASAPNRTRLAAWNVATLLVFTAVTTVTGLAATPWIVHWLNEERYGAAKLIGDYGGYLALLELGLGGALSPLLARAAGQGDERTLQGTIAAGVRLYLGVAVLIVTVGLLLGTVVGRLVPVSSAFVGDLRLAWFIAVSGFALLVLSPFRALTEARQWGYRVNLLLTAQAVLIAALSLLWAWRGWGITGQVLALLVGNTIVSLVLARDGARHHPGLLRTTLTVRPAPETWRALWRLSPPTLAINLCGRIGLLTDYIVVSQILGVAPITTLFLTQRLAVLAQAQLQGIGGAAWAGLAELHARGELGTFRRRLIELTNMVAILGVAMLGPIVAYNRHFFVLWVPSQSYGGDVVVLVAAANALLLGLSSLWNWCFVGTGQVRLVLPLIAAGSVVNLAASVSLTWWLRSMSGPLLGTTLAALVVNLWAMPLLLRQTFGVSLRALASAVATPLAWGTLYTAGLWWLAHIHRPRGWLGLAAETGLAVLGFLALAWFILLNSTDRNLWRQRLTGLLPNRVRRREHSDSSTLEDV